MSVCQRNEQKPIKHSEKLIYSTRSRPAVHHRIRGKNHARTSTKPLCGSSKRLLRSIKPQPVGPSSRTVLRKVLFRCAHPPGLRSMSDMGILTPLTLWTLGKMPSKPLLIWVKKTSKTRRSDTQTQSRSSPKNSPRTEEAPRARTRICDVTLVTSPVSKLLDQVRRSEDYAINVFQRNPGF